MRMQILKIVVVLLAAGSGDTRPQKSGRCFAKKKKNSLISRKIAMWKMIGLNVCRGSNKTV